jgi:hypothetical protein
MPVTPNMTLDLPSVSVTVGPDWATLLNAALTLVDAHDHTTGKGVKITPAGLNINADVDFNESYIGDCGGLRLKSHSAVLVTPSDIRELYSVSGDLYYNNSSGTAVQITSGGSVTAASDGTARKFDRASVNSNTTINAAATVSYYDVDTTSSVTFTLPAANGVSAGRFYEFKDTTGNAGTNNIIINRAGSDTIDGATSVTLNVNYQSVRLISDGTSKWASSEIKTNEIATAMIKDSAITTAKINNAAVTQAKRAALGEQLSSSSGAFSSSTTGSAVDITNLTVTITTTGRPVFVGIIGDGTTSNSVIRFNQGGASLTAFIFFVRGSTVVSQMLLSQSVTGSTALDFRAMAFPWHIDVPAAGTYTYKIQAQMSNSTGAETFEFQYLKLIAYEL